jgi:hypothetical protein
MKITAWIAWILHTHTRNVFLSFKESAQVLAQDDKTDIDIPPEQAMLKYNTILAIPR